MKTKLLILLIVSASSLFGQSQTKVAPDCSLGSISFSGTGSSSNFDNRVTSQNNGVPCTLWSLEWYAESGVTSLTINIQGAPDSNGMPGAFSTLAMGSTFPNGKLNWQSSSSYSPWMRVNISAVGAAGTINATLNGWRDNAASIGGGGASSGCPNPCPVEGVTATGAAATEPPVLNGALDGSANKAPLILGTKSATVSLTASGLTQLIALSGTTVIRLSHISVAFASAVDFQLEYGTGSACATGTTALTGTYKSILTVALDFDLDPLLIPAGDALCANLGASVTGGGLVKFAQY